MPLYFLRHGQSENNILKLFSGRSDIRLTKKGEDQARQAADKIRDLNISRIISSPLKRTLRTAEIVAETVGYDKRRIEKDARLIEYDIGELAGTAWRKVSPEEFSKVKGAESTVHFQNRLVSFLNEYKDAEENILVVSHGGVYRMIESARLGLHPDSFHSVNRPPNAKHIELDLKWLDLK